MDRIVTLDGMMEMASPAVADTIGTHTGAAIQVVYVNYRSRDYLARSLHSLLANTGSVPGVEITVVDNSCDRDEADAIDALLPSGARLLRCEENRGFARACNLGASVGTAPHILFLNPDTVLLPDTLERLWHALEERNGNALIGPRHYADVGCEYAHAPFRGTRLFDEAWDLVFARGWDPQRPLRYLRDRARLVDTTEPTPVRSISGGCLAVGRTAFELIGGWNENYWMYGEDLELCVRARSRGVKALLLPDVGLVHFMEGSSQHEPERVEASQHSSRVQYKKDRHSWLARSFDRLATRLAGRLPRRGDLWGGITEWDGEPLMAPADSRRWAIELARSPLFDNCLTAFPKPREAILPLGLLDTLQPATYYMRVAGESATGRWHQTCLHSVTKPHPG